jgi:hypothetical protein
LLSGVTILAAAISPVARVKTVDIERELLDFDIERELLRGVELVALTGELPPTAP